MIVLSVVCTTLVALVFAIAGLSKIIRPKPFVSALRGYSILPKLLLPVVAIGLPLLEISLALLILRDRSNVIVAGSCAALLCGFAAAMATNLVQGKEGSCGCGLAGDAKISWLLVFRSVAFAGMSFAGTGYGAKLAGFSLGMSLLFTVLALRPSGNDSSRSQVATAAKGA
jgi:Methylamine utilisation protein MauE